MFRFDADDVVALAEGLPALLLVVLFFLMAYLGGR